MPLIYKNNENTETYEVFRLNVRLCPAPTNTTPNTENLKGSVYNGLKRAWIFGRGCAQRIRLTEDTKATDPQECLKVCCVVPCRVVEVERIELSSKFPFGVHLRV